MALSNRFVFQWLRVTKGDTILSISDARLGGYLSRISPNSLIQSVSLAYAIGQSGSCSSKTNNRYVPFLKTVRYFVQLEGKAGLWNTLSSVICTSTAGLSLRNWKTATKVDWRRSKKLSNSLDKAAEWPFPIKLTTSHKPAFSRCIFCVDLNGIS